MYNTVNISINTAVFLFLSGAFAIMAIVMLFTPRRPAVLAGYGMLLSAWLSGITAVDIKTLIFWAIATILTLGLNMILPRNIAKSRSGVPFICGGTITATCVGMLFNTTAGVILGAMAGAILGAIAFSNTEKGRPMEFPSQKFFNYTAAKGLPAVVTTSMVAISMLYIISYFHV